MAVARLSPRFMNWRFKFVAVLLGLALFGSPMLALVRCTAKETTARHCGDDCPMMMHSRQASTSRVSENTSRDGSCCQVSSLPENRMKPAATIPASFLRAAVGEVVAALLPTVASPAEALSEQVLKPRSFSQALLCTFLI